MLKSVRSLLYLLTVTLLALPMMAEDDASEAPKAFLKEGDIERFIETFPKMVAELEELDEEYENISDPSMAQTLMAHAEFRKVLEEYEWDEESYLHKLTAITSGYALVRIEAELAEVPAEQRAMMQAMLGSQLQSQFSVHPDDLALVREHWEKLERFFEEL
jgi:flagellar biosynthesis/type III secretory pathway protein FliH